MAILRFVDDEKENVAERKASLRAYMKELRAGIDNKDVKAEQATRNAIEYLEKKRKENGGDIVFVYQSFSTEMDTDMLISQLQEKGFRVYCPKIENKVMYAVALGEDFTISKFGIREPIGDKLLTSPHYVITPLLAVDKQGNRLGYGKGYYDGYFARYPNALRIGYAFDRQVIRQVPTEHTDIQLQTLITETDVWEIE